MLPIAAGGHLGVGAAGYGLLLGALGIGALLGVVFLPRIRARIANNTVLAVSALLFASGAAAAGFLPPFAVVILMVIAGAAWIGCLSTFSAVMQLTLPAWVRARGMSMYLFVMSGTQAIGAFIWGAVAAAFCYGDSLAASAILLVAAGASIFIWPLLPGTGQLDRTVAGPSEVTDVLAERQDPGAGPVNVLITYRPDPARFEDFAVAMAQVKLTRLRTGATDWQLVCPIGQAGYYTEFYTVPTWREYRRQEQDRITGEDHRHFARARASSTKEPRTSWYLPA